MENESKKYKNYLIILVLFAIVSFVLGYYIYAGTLEQKRAVDEVFEIVTNGDTESQQQIVDRYNESAPEGEKNYTRQSVILALEEMKKGEIYIMLDEGRDTEVISVLSMQWLSTFHGFMLVVAALTAIEKRFLKGLNNVLRVILNICAVIVLIPEINYIIPLGAIGLPIVIVYCVIKYIKTRNKKQENTEDCVNVMGKVDADEVFESKNETEE